MENPFHVGLEFGGYSFLERKCYVVYYAHGEIVGNGLIGIKPSTIVWKRFYPNNKNIFSPRSGFGTAAHVQTLHSLVDVIGDDVFDMDVCHEYYTLSIPRRKQLEAMGIDVTRKIPFYEYYEKSVEFYLRKFEKKEIRSSDLQPH